MALLLTDALVFGAGAIAVAARAAGERRCSRAWWTYAKTEWPLDTKWRVGLYACPDRVRAGRPVDVRAWLAADVGGLIATRPTFHRDTVRLTVTVSAAGAGPVRRDCPVRELSELTPHQVHETGEDVVVPCDVVLPAGVREPVRVTLSIAADVRDDGLDALVHGPVVAVRDRGRVTCEPFACATAARS